MGIQFNSEKMNLLAHCLLASILACLFLDNVVSATSTRELLKFPTEREASLKEFDNSVSQSPMGDASTLVDSIGSFENLGPLEEDKRSRIPRSPKKGHGKRKKCRRGSRIKSLEEQQMEFEGHLRGRRAADRSKFQKHQWTKGHLRGRRAADRSKFQKHQFIEG